MIPYIQFTSFSLGPLTFHVWGIMVALGIILGTTVSAKFAKSHGLSKDKIYEQAFWIILSSLIGARLLHVLVYSPQIYLSDPLEVLRIWNGGMSVMGGFLGALLAYLVYIKKEKLNFLSYADSLIYGLPLGLGVGRIGCFLIHDHPGTLTHMITGVKFPDGVRHDLGLYLSINGFALALLFFLLNKQPRKSGFYVKLFLLWYGVTRFSLDFLRIVDRRFFGLTPAQYISICMILVAFYWIGKDRLDGKIQT